MVIFQVPLDGEVHFRAAHLASQPCPNSTGLRPDQHQAIRRGACCSVAIKGDGAALQTWPKTIDCMRKLWHLPSVNG